MNNVNYNNKLVAINAIRNEYATDLYALKNNEIQP